MGAPELSVVIPVYNQLNYTRQCVDSLIGDRERVPMQLIIVDNASTDGTKEYLDSLAERLKTEGIEWTRISNERNLGVAPAWNQGLRACQADEIAILNNDILATDGWVQGLRSGMKRHGLALACPYAVNGPLDYSLAQRAKSFIRRNRGSVWREYSFCAFYLPRRTFEKIGFFDEKFLVGGFEDTDYCYRLRRENLAYGIVGSSFIHHFGSATLGEFKKLGDKHAGPNRAYFVQKWGEDPSARINSLPVRARRFIRKIQMKLDRM